jgi:hypothetical protein
MLALRSIAAVLGAGSAIALASDSPAEPARGGSAGTTPPAGGSISPRFVGLSVEWSLVERYANPADRPVLARLLRNLGGGTLRVGGASQDLMPFVGKARNTHRVVTLDDLRAVRATLDAAPGWQAILGTTMTPRTEARPWAAPAHARGFVARGVRPAFAGAEHRVAGIELGNEPDLTYRTDVARYVRDLRRYVRRSAPFPAVAGSTSEPIAPWRTLGARGDDLRYFWRWDRILGAAAPAVRSTGGWAADHFYPTKRDCSDDPYRCSSITRLLSRERMDNLAYQTFVHAREARRHGLAFRMEEMNSAAGRGVAGVSDVAASALWALDAMFTAACPQPPDRLLANADCRIGATGVNFHCAEARDIFVPDEGNAYYNPIAYGRDGLRAMPEYYALLLFARFAQGTRGLRPVPTGREALRAWGVDAGAAGRRVFLINTADRPTDITLPAGPGTYAISRLRGASLAARTVTIDGRRVAADGTWPGFAPVTGATAGGRLRVPIGAAEAAVVTFRPAA